MTRFNLGVPWCVVVGFVVLGWLVVMGGALKAGGTIMALGPLAGSVMRAVLPERYVLDIKVRSRAVDIVLYLAVAAVVFVAFTMVRS